MWKIGDVFNRVGSCAIALPLLIGSAMLIGCDAGREESAVSVQTPSAPASPPPPCVIDCGGTEGSGGSDGFDGGGSGGSSGENIDETPKYQVSSASGNAPPDLPTIQGRYYMEYPKEYSTVY